MNKKFFLISLFLTVFGLTPTFSKEKISELQLDSLRHLISSKSGEEKMSAQLELSILISESSTQEAQALVESALTTAKATHNAPMMIKSHIALGRIYELTNRKNLSEECFNTALVIADSIKDNWLKGEILYRKGMLKNGAGKELDALELFNQALQACRLSNNFKVMGSAYSMMGVILRVNGLYDRAIEYTINSKLNYEKAGLQEGHAWAAYVLGRIYFDIKVYQKAKEYFQESVSFYLKQRTIDGLNGVVICYTQLGLLLLEEHKYMEAKELIEKTLEINSEIKSEHGITNSQKNLGMIEYNLGNYDVAEKLLTESLRRKLIINDLLSLPIVYQYLGLIQVKKGETDKGLETIHKGLKMAISNSQKKVQLDIYSKLTNVYLDNHDFNNAVHCQKRQIEIQDTLLLGSANIKIEQLQSVYELDKKSAQIIELEKQNEINSLLINQHKTSTLIMVSAIAIAILISLIIFWFNTKMRKKNQQLKETNAAKDKLFAIVAHDLRGPTGNFTTFLEFLTDKFDEFSPNELKDLLTALFKSANEVNILLEDLLIWAQTQLNKIAYLPSEVELSKTIQNSFKGLAQSANIKQINVKLELDDQIVVMADPNMVQTIVRNLLSNAIKFTHRGGAITINSKIINRDYAEIRIIDNGIGIKKEAISNLFSMSNTHRSPGTENEKSTGLGLVIVKEFVEKNKGTISIESEIKKGTTVIISLPLTTYKK